MKEKEKEKKKQEIKNRLLTFNNALPRRKERPSTFILKKNTRHQIHCGSVCMYMCMCMFVCVYMCFNR